MRWPPSINHYWRTVRGRAYISAEGKRFREHVETLLRGVRPIEGRLRVHVCVHPPDKRRRDVDNLLKPLLDALQAAGLFEDDEAIDDLRIMRGEPAEGGEAWVLVTPV